MRTGRDYLRSCLINYLASSTFFRSSSLSLRRVSLVSGLLYIFASFTAGTYLAQSRRLGAPNEPSAVWRTAPFPATRHAWDCWNSSIQRISSEWILRGFPAYACGSSYKLVVKLHQRFVHGALGKLGDHTVANLMLEHHRLGYLLHYIIQVNASH